MRLEGGGRVSKTARRPDHFMLGVRLGVVLASPERASENSPRRKVWVRREKKENQPRRGGGKSIYLCRIKQLECFMPEGRQLPRN